MQVKKIFKWGIMYSFVRGVAFIFYAMYCIFTNDMQSLYNVSIKKYKSRVVLFNTLTKLEIIEEEITYEPYGGPR